MVGSRIATTLNSDGPVASIVVRPVTFVKALMFGGLFFITKLMIDESEIVMGRQVFGIEFECLFESFGSLRKKLLLLRFVAAFEFGPFKERLAEFVDDFVILAEIKIALVKFCISIFQNAPELRDCFVQIRVVLVHEA